MDISIHVKQADVDRLKRAYDRWNGHELVQERLRLNVQPNVHVGAMERVWECLVLALTTSQQRSGPGTGVWRLWSTDPCPLSLRQFREWNPNISREVANFLKGWGGIRCYNRIGEYTEHNHRLLFERGGWEQLQPTIKQLADRMAQPCKWNEEDLVAERQACKLVMGLGLKGIGNKQCRNWLMNCRLLRYELPLDSRVLKFIRPMMTTLPLEQELLLFESYYHFVEDAVHEVCRRAGIIPCVADAVMFLSAEGES